MRLNDYPLPGVEMLVSVDQAQMFFLALTRIMAIIIHVPVLAGNVVPNMVRIGLGILLTLVMVPWQPLPESTTGEPMVVFAFSIGREIIVGSLAGFAAALAFGALEVTGELMGVGSGFASARTINPALQTSGSAMDQLFFMFAMLIFLSINGHHLFLVALQRTFELVPLNSGLPALGMERLLEISAGMITIGIQLALPLTGALLLADLTLALLSKAAPQIQVFFLGVPLKIGLALIGLGLTLNVLLPNLTSMFTSLSKWMLQLLGA